MNKNLLLFWQVAETYICGIGQIEALYVSLERRMKGKRKRGGFFGGFFFC